MRAAAVEAAERADIPKDADLAQQEIRNRLLALTVVTASRSPSTSTIRTFSRVGFQASSSCASSWRSPSRWISRTSYGSGGRLCCRRPSGSNATSHGSDHGRA
jgi:hypothetical protein